MKRAPEMANSCCFRRFYSCNLLKNESFGFEDCKMLAFARSLWYNKAIL